jgi:glycosyltransferase involved in cell wall biosynthesis
MKILIVFPFSKVSTGISSYTFSVIEALNSSDIITFEFASNHKEWISETKDFKKLIFFNFFNFLSKLLILFSLDTILLNLNMFFFRINNINISQYDHIFFTTAIPLFHIKSTKIIVSVHDLMHRYEIKFKEASSFLTYSYREKLYSLIGSKAQLILVDSILGKKQFIDSYSVSNSKIIEILPFIAPSYIYDYINSTSNVFERDNCLFYPASFWPHKNHINLLKAFLILKHENFSLKLVFCGKKNSYRKKIEAFIIENGLSESVKIYDYLTISELIDFYKKSHALIMPTFFGPTNIPPIEALLFNCKIIVSNNYAMAEQFEDAAIYIDPNSVSSIVDAIKLSYDFNPVNIDKVKSKFSKELFSSRLVSLLKSRKC